MAENSAKLSSPVERVSMSVTRLPVLPLVMLMPSAKMFRIREFLIVMLSVLVPQYMQTWCSTQMFSIVMFDTLREVEHLARPVDARGVVAEVGEARERRAVGRRVRAEAEVGVLLPGGAWNLVNHGPAPTTLTALPYTWNLLAVW